MFLYFYNGARRENRTLTTMLHDFESCASTSSAMRAAKSIITNYNSYYNASVYLDSNKLVSSSFSSTSSILGRSSIDLSPK